MQTRHEQWRGLCLRHDQVTRDKRSTPHQGRRKVQRKPQTESRHGECAICCPPNCYLITAAFTIENVSRCKFDTNQCLGAYVFRILSADSACGFSTSTIGNFRPKIFNVWFIMCGWWNASTWSCNNILLGCCTIQKRSAPNCLPCISGMHMSHQWLKRLYAFIPQVYLEMYFSDGERKNFYRIANSNWWRKQRATQFGSKSWKLLAFSLPNVTKIDIR